MVQLVTKLWDNLPLILLGSEYVANTGGNGKDHDNAKLYQMIGPSTTNNPDNISLELEIYY